MHRAGAASRRAPFVVLVVGLLVATTLALLLLNTAIAVDSLDATQQRVANAEQAKQVDRLEQQVIDGSTATALAQAATAAGMVPAGAAAHLVLEPGGESALRGNAVPAAPPSSAPAARSTSAGAGAAAAAAPTAAAPTAAAPAATGRASSAAASQTPGN